MFQVTQPKRNPPTDEPPPSFSPSSSSLSLHVIQRSIPVRVPSNAALPPIGYERRQREDSFSDLVGKGSGSRTKSTTALAPPLPGMPLRARRSPLLGHREITGLPTFLCVLAANKRKNPYAPSLISRFNPLRDYVPPCAWASRGVPLTSARFRTPLSLLPLRCRSYVRLRSLSWHR